MISGPSIILSWFKLKAQIRPEVIITSLWAHVKPFATTSPKVMWSSLRWVKALKCNVFKCNSGRSRLPVTLHLNPIRRLSSWISRKTWHNSIGFQFHLHITCVRNTRLDGLQISEAGERRLTLNTRNCPKHHTNKESRAAHPPNLIWAKHVKISVKMLSYSIIVSPSRPTRRQTVKKPTETLGSIHFTNPPD